MPCPNEVALLEWRWLFYSMATETPDSIQSLTPNEITATMGSIKKMIMIGALFVAVGYALLLLAGVEDVFTIWAWADSTKMWFKLGGVGHILIGIFVSLVAIVRTLGLVPHRLGQLE